MAKIFRLKKSEEDDWNLDDILFAKWFAREEEKRLKRGVMTIINPPQAEKFKKVVEYFQKLTKEFGGEVKVELVPADLCGFLTVVLQTLYLPPEDLKEFISILSIVDVLNIVALLSGEIEIGINVNDVFTEVEKRR